MNNEMKLINDTIITLEKELKKNKKLIKKKEEEYVLKRCFKIKHYNGTEYFIPKCKGKDWYYGISYSLNSGVGKPYIKIEMGYNSFHRLANDDDTKVITYRNLLLEVNKLISRYEEINVKEYICESK